MEARTSSSSNGPSSSDNLHKSGDIVDGRYVLVEPLGKGGMGVVWKARSAALGVEVALKLVNRSQTGVEPLQRMAREAHAAARLGHPAMVTVLDFGTTATGDPYVAMELLRGDSLADVLQREHRLDARRAVATLLPIIDGLGAAHDKGIVHRDVKPENLFISKDAQGRIQPKLLDFGIAKLEQQGEHRQRLTLDGTVLGSPGYFSPEQARGQVDIDSRTDIWSICVVLYELITGELPFSGANYNALLMSILKDKPASLVAQGVGDEALWKILRQGLAKERKQRWSSMWELGQALAYWLYQNGVRTDVSSRSLKEAWLEAEVTGVRMHVNSMPANDSQRGAGTSTTRGDRTTASTLAGETVSTLIRRHAVHQRRLSWGVLTLGGCAALWALASPTPAPAQMAPEAIASMLPAPPSEPRADEALASAGDEGTAAADAPHFVGGGRGSMRPATPAKAPLPAARAPERSLAKVVSVSAKAASAPVAQKSAPSAKPPSVKPSAAPALVAPRPTKKAAALPARPVRVDKEFGF
jgi:eukaryotic-like serine/threonine-protein kinase